MKRAEMRKMTFRLPEEVIKRITETAKKRGISTDVLIERKFGYGGRKKRVPVHNGAVEPTA